MAAASGVVSPLGLLAILPALLWLDGIVTAMNKQSSEKISNIRHDIPYITRRCDILSNQINPIVPERTLRIPWGRKGQFIPILYDPKLRRVRKTFRQWLRDMFRR